MKPKFKLPRFFKDKEKSYVLNFPILQVFDLINNIPKTTGVWGDNNIVLRYFDGNSFSIQLIRLGASGGGQRHKLSSSMYGEIEKKNDFETTICTKIKGSLIIYFSFCLCIIGGLIFLGKFIILKETSENLLWGVIMIFVLPYLLVWYKKVTDVAVRENFEDYLSKNLRKSN